MTTWQVLTSVAAATLIVLAIVLIAFWKKRAAARRWLEAMAEQYGLRRKPTETDEELRERMRLALQGPPRGTREDLRIMVKDALWGHGYRRIDVDVTSEPGTGTVRAHAKAAVPLGVLRVIERELADQMPVTMHLELSSDDRREDR